MVTISAIDFLNDPRLRSTLKEAFPEVAGLESLVGEGFSELRLRAAGLEPDAGSVWLSYAGRALPSLYENPFGKFVGAGVIRDTQRSATAVHNNFNTPDDYQFFEIHGREFELTVAIYPPTYTGTLR